MPDIIVYYKSDKPAEGPDILKAYGVFRKRGLPTDKDSLKVEAKDDHESKLRKIVYSFPFELHLPMDSDLEKMSEEIIDKCSDINIKKILCIGQGNRQYEMTVKNKENE